MDSDNWTPLGCWIPIIDETKSRRPTQASQASAGEQRRQRGLDKPEVLRRRAVQPRMQQQAAQEGLDVQEQELVSLYQTLRQPERSPAATRSEFRTAGVGGRAENVACVFQQDRIGAK
jgi:hypothetical protein